MPLYDYECDRCGAVTEVLVRGSDPASEKPLCESCGSGAVRRALSTFSTGSTAGRTGDAAPDCGPGFT